MIAVSSPHTAIGSSAPAKSASPTRSTRPSLTSAIALHTASASPGSTAARRRVRSTVTRATERDGGSGRARSAARSAPGCRPACARGARRRRRPSPAAARPPGSRRAAARSTRRRRALRSDRRTCATPDRGRRLAEPLREHAAARVIVGYDLGLQAAVELQHVLGVRSQRYACRTHSPGRSRRRPRGRTRGRPRYRAPARARGRQAGPAHRPAPGAARSAARRARGRMRPTSRPRMRDLARFFFAVNTGHSPTWPIGEDPASGELRGRAPTGRRGS